MTLYALTLSLIVTSLFLFSSKTEQSRIVTVHRPLVITQERKSPAYYVYQQTRRLQSREPAAAAEVAAPSTHLNRLSLAPEHGRLQVAEMTLTRREYAALRHREAVPSLRTLRGFQNEFLDAALEPVVAPDSGAEEVAGYAGTASTASATAESPEPTYLDPARKWATVKGKFELTDGVGIVDHVVELKRMEEGQVREVGQISLSTGSYSIDIQSPSGYLIAQIKDRSTGGLVGEARARLVNLQGRGSYFEGPFIRVGQPGAVAMNFADRSAAAAAVSVSLFDGQNTLKKAADSFGNIGAFSSTISRAYDPARVYKNVTSIRHTADDGETAVFTAKWVDGVVEYVSDLRKVQFKNRNAPVLIGRVLVDGKPAANAQVQIEGHPGLLPVYFDQFLIPAPAQSGTSDNGYFMFVGVESGIYNVVASRQNLLLGSQHFVAEDEALGFQNISSRSVPRYKTVRSFDAFTSAPVPADVITAESEEVLETADAGVRFQSRSGAGVGEFTVRSDDRRYMPMRYVYDSRQDYAHVPMLSEAWLAGLQTVRQINLFPSAGIIVGFTRDLEYDSYLAVENYDRGNIVYFDAGGNAVAAPVKGGGFVLFNVPAGAREVILQERGTDRIHSQVFPVRDQQVSVAHFTAD